MRGKTRRRRHRTRSDRVLTGVPRARDEDLDDGTGAAPERRAGSRVFVSHCGPRPVVTVVGALDARGATLLSAVLDQVRRSERAAAEVDLSRVHYADSHGLAPLLDAQVTIRRTSPVVGRLLVALGIPSRRPSSSEPAPG